MSVFLEVLDKIDHKLKRMTEQVETARWLWNAGHFEAAFEHAFQLEDTAERTTLLTRVLPAYTGRPSAREDVRGILAKGIPVKLGFTAQGWFALYIPALLPRKRRGSVDYIRDFLYPAMQDFFRDKDPVQYTDCVLVFRHVYNRDRPERQRRDHDNIETNIVTDIVALYTIPDDSPSVCDHHYCTAAAAEDRTEVYVVPRDDFPLWLDVEKSIPEKGLPLYEKRGDQP